MWRHLSQKVKGDGGTLYDDAIQSSTSVTQLKMDIWPLESNNSGQRLFVRFEVYHSLNDDVIEGFDLRYDDVIFGEFLSRQTKVFNAALAES